MWDWIGKAHELNRIGQQFAMVTVVDTKGSSPRDAGAKMVVLPNGSFFGTIGGGQLEHLAIEDAVQALAESVSGHKKYPLCFRAGQCCGGGVEVYIELVGVNPQLYIFGAGHVGQALANVMQGTPFRVHLIDERKEWIDAPLAAGTTDTVIRHHTGPKQFLKDMRPDRHWSYVIVMTHDHFLDLDLISELAVMPARFIGLIGSRNKWQKFTQRLTHLGVDQDAMNRIECPVGIPFGGKTPAEIAISIGGRLLQVFHETGI
jgi:xanthine dehydrogenase accessory factor